jgi:hypothetical protein
MDIDQQHSRVVNRRLRRAAGHRQSVTLTEVERACQSLEQSRDMDS